MNPAPSTNDSFQPKVEKNRPPPPLPSRVPCGQTGSQRFVFFPLPAPTSKPNRFNRFPPRGLSPASPASEICHRGFFTFSKTWWSTTMNQPLRRRKVRPRSRGTRKTKGALTHLTIAVDTPKKKQKKEGSSEFSISSMTIGTPRHSTILRTWPPLCTKHHHRGRRHAQKQQKQPQPGGLFHNTLPGHALREKPLSRQLPAR